MTENVNEAAKFSLTEEQYHCVNEIEISIDKNIFDTFLIYGLTGSGKTAVYIEAIKKIRKKKTVILIIINIYHNCFPLYDEE